MIAETAFEPGTDMGRENDYEAAKLRNRIYCSPKRLHMTVYGCITTERWRYYNYGT